MKMKILFIAKWIFPPLILIYFSSMFIVPLFMTNLNWQKIQNIWDRWQSLNVGMLAISSSLIALFITQYKEEKQRNRSFIAEKSFLPHALSELSHHLVESSKIIKDRAEKSLHNPNGFISVPGTEKVPGRKTLDLPKFEIPSYPDKTIIIFKECIRYADPEVGDYLSHILKRYQIHYSRILGMNNELLQGYSYYKSCLYSAAELQALINNIFDYARNEGNFNSSIHKWDLFRIAFKELNINLEEFDDLESFTKRILKTRSQTS